MSQVKFINKENLKIARENMGLTSVAASAHISSSEKDIISEWESGAGLPSWAQVSKLAKLYNIPELLFFSEEKIQKSKMIPDYRVSANHENDEKVKKLVNLVITRQRWLEKELKELNFSKNRLQGSGKNIQTPGRLALFIKESLGIDIEEIKRISGEGGRKKALDYLIDKAEEAGVFVGKTISYHDLEVDDMRGLFISNDYCPFIVINRRDALSAQIFSFAHELSHLFRKSDAISNSLDFRTTNNNVDPEEVFCNKVAAELLLPESDFQKAAYGKTDIDEISELYKVSKISIFYRLKDLNKIPHEIERDLEKKIKEEMDFNLTQKKILDKKKKGGNYTNSMRDSNGTLFNNLVSKSYLENKIGYVEASNLLRFSVEKV